MRRRKHRGFGASKSYRLRRGKRLRKYGVSRGGVRL